MSDIDDPFKPADSVVRPRPGAGRRGTPDPGHAPLPPAVHTDPLPISALDALALGHNPLVQAASPLLILAGQLRGTLAGPDVPTLRRQALDEIRRFEERARTKGVQNEVVVAARYALCAGLDEAVLSTPWGAQSEWAQQPLLVTLHREAWGGEKFFDMLERISQDPARHIDLMELQYLCVVLGFEGKYRVADRGYERLADVQHALYRRIREVRGQAKPELSLRWEGLQDRRNPVIRYIPWWIVGAAVLAILAVTYTVYRVRLTGDADRVRVKLSDIGQSALKAPIPAAPAGAQTLKQLLVADDGRALDAVEAGGKTTVTLRAPNLFASGSASVNPEYIPVLERIGTALKQVPGRVYIVGHTDNQRSRDNLGLSLARAQSVGVVIKSKIENAGRLVFDGKGDTAPLYLPESDPANRARNRRVEIIHIRGS